MIRSYYVLVLFLYFPLLTRAQTNVGIGGAALRARLEVFAGVNPGVSSAVFGTDGTGISFQQNWPGVGFNQYRDVSTGYGKYMGTGYAAVQFMNPADGSFALDMQSASGFGNNTITIPYHRAFSIFSNGTVSFGKGFLNSNLVVDYLNVSGSNTANGSIQFQGTQYNSAINQPTSNFTPGKDGGTTYINDISNGNTVIGSGSTGVLAINTNPLYLTSLSIRHPLAGGGLALVEEINSNKWEWYVSNDNPVWIGQKYNGLLIGDYDPVTGQHGYVSDRRLKNAIRPMAPVMENLMKLQAVEYRMLSQKEDATPGPGFIAQEVRKLFPELVAVMPGNSAGEKALTDLHMLNYSQFFVLGIKAIQEQQVEIAALTRQLEKLEQSLKK